MESFPTAFAIPIGLIKLVQGLWLLDHHDHQVKALIENHYYASKAIEKNGFACCVLCEKAFTNSETCACIIRPHDMTVLGGFF